MNILLIIKNFRMGGAETHVRELANSLVCSGHRVVLVARDGEQKHNLHKEVEFVSMPLSDWRYVWQINTLKKLITQYDIDIVHGHQRMAISMAARAAKSTATPCIATIHGQLKHDIRAVRIRQLLDAVICVRQQTLLQTQQCADLANKSHLILNGVSEYATVHKTVPYKIMYGSRHDKRHGWLINLLIEEVIPQLKAEYPEVTLDVWGNGDQHDLLRQAGDRINQIYPDTVRFGGYSKCLGQEYQRADLVIACARSAMDALVAGTPTLAANFHHLGEVIDGQNYHRFKLDNFEAKGFPKPTTEQLVTKISDYFKQRKTIREQFATLNQQVLQDLTTEASVSKTVAMYHQVLAAHAQTKK